MNSFEAAVLGVVQGLTEFLPVSSSGHLVIAKHLMQADPPGGGPVLELIAHLGTLLAVFLFFNREVVDIVRYATWGGWIRTRARGWRVAWWEDASGRMTVAVLLASFVTAAIGLAFKDAFERAFDSVRVAGMGLLVTSALLGVALALRRREGWMAFPDAKAALGVGLAQALAIVPGISRSGSTIVAGLILGLRREMAFAFSFLISMPAILGASIVEFAGAPAKDIPALAPSAILFGASLAAGLVSLVLLRILVRKGNFGWFVLYVLPLGIWAVLFL